MKMFNAIEKAYMAGIITYFGKFVIYGECAERGTYPPFANIELNNLNFNLSKEALVHFTQITNTALRNSGLTSKKKNFYLSQNRNEILPLIRNFGLENLYEDAWSIIRLHDSETGLEGRWTSGNHSRLENWEQKTMKLEVCFSDCDAHIMNHVISSILQNIDSDEQSYENEDILINAFLEAKNGLFLGTDDFKALQNQDGILDRYFRYAA